MASFFLFRSIKAKLLLTVLIILGTGVSAVLLLSTKMNLESSEGHVRKNASDSANGYRALIRQLVTQSEDRARTWAMTRATGGNLKSLIAVDSTIRGIEVFRADSVSEYREFQEGWDVAVETADLVSLLSKTTDEIPHVYSTVKTTSGKTLHRVLSTFAKNEDGSLKLGLAFYLDPEVFNSSLTDESVSLVLIYKSDGEVLFQSAGVSASDLLTGARVPEKLLEVFASANVNNVQSRIETSQHEKYVGSLYKVGLSDLAVAVLTSEIHIFEQPRRTALYTLYLGLAILFLSFAFVILFSDSLVKPVKILVEATKRIATGDFAVRSVVKTRDEIYQLSKSFNEMASGLQERERIKDIFGKFHSKAVVEKLFKEDKVRLGGERLPVTVFFSDIRGFTSSSEVLSPEAVVEMLNEYLTEMVAIIELHDGVVDKYVGDAIMAVWGMPEPDPSKDAFTAVTACLRMREKLVELNERRALRGQPPLKIGMGLNSGDVIAGNIGSQSRMEYTVIGDTVNTASRMESATKDFSTDFLLNESTVKLLPPGAFELDGPYEASAKGKSDKIHVYKVIGFAAKVTKRAV
jgi:class 3 adenylate cyclase